jgi:rhomboid protease GluP
MAETGPRRMTRATYSVDFGSFFSFRSLELIGRGEVEIYPTEPILELRGRSNGVFRRPARRVFTSSEIKNLRGSGRILEFDAGDTSNPGRSRTIGFTCDSVEDAAAIRNALPNETEHTFRELSQFHASLDSLPQAASPWRSVTTILIALNVLAFVVMGFLGAGWVEVASMRPYIEFAANNGAATTQGEWWRLVTAMFVHYGIVHLAFNMWALLDAGRVVERLIGRLPFALAYMSSGILSGFSSQLWHQDRTWSAGASGAVFGVYGMLLGFMLKEKASTPSIILRPVLKSVLFFAGYNLLYGFIQPRIDNAAHIGGFVSGFGLGWILALPPDPGIRALHQRGRMLLALGATTALCAAAIALSPHYDYLFRDRLALERTYDATMHAREVAIRQQQAALFSKIKKSGSSEELAQWIEGSALPFYRASAEKLAALPLTPGYRTDGERNAMLYVARSKIAHYERLASDLRLMDPTALIRFDASENAVSKSAQEKLSPKSR